MLISLLRQLFGRSGKSVAAYSLPEELDLRPEKQELLDAAIAHLKKRDHASATALCEELLERDPTLAGAHEVLGLIALENGDEERACTCFDAALEATGPHPRSLGNAAEIDRKSTRLNSSHT